MVGLVASLGTGCGLFGGDAEADDMSVFSVEPGQCFEAPTEPEAQVSEVQRLDCTDPHDQEAYAVVPYQALGDAAEEEATTPGDTFPGDDALTQFAQGACAEKFGSYVGISYLDSSLFFTYLLPSPRSWQDEDRSVVCFVSSPGERLTDSVKGSKK